MRPLPLFSALLSHISGGVYGGYGRGDSGGLSEGEPHRQINQDDHHRPYPQQTGEPEPLRCVRVCVCVLYVSEVYCVYLQCMCMYGLFGTICLHFVCFV